MKLAIIDQSIFEKISLESKSCFLLCFYTLSTFDAEKLKSLEEVSQHFTKTVQIYIANESDLAFFQNAFSFGGTPTYIFFQDGVEKERLLGEVSKETLTKFITSNIHRNDQGH